MAPKLSKAEKKVNYDKKMCRLMDEYTQVLVVAADNVGSTQLQSIRKGLRGDSVVLMGKNTMMKRTVRIHSENTGNSAILSLVPLLVVSPIILFISEIIVVGSRREWICMDHMHVYGLYTFRCSRLCELSLLLCMWIVYIIVYESDLKMICLRP